VTGTSQPGPVPGTLPAPGVVPAPPPPVVQPAPQPEPAPQPPPVSEPQAATAAPSAAPAQAQGAPAAQIVITPPGAEFKVGGGPYTVPVSIANAPRVSALSLSITYNPAVLRVRSVQEGSFMRQGGVTASFTRQIDEAAGRVDLTLTRGQDIVGASGGGLVAALLIEPVAAGTATLAVSGAGTGPAGSLVNLQAAPASVNVK
jgi:hypothetical protein